jgi:glutaredoxin-like protein
MSDITMYSAEWCGDCRRSKRLLAELGVEYTLVDVENDPTAAAKVVEINGGAQSIPVIVFSDGTHLTEPSDNDLKAKLQSASDKAQLMLLLRSRQPPQKGLLESAQLPQLQDQQVADQSPEIFHL